MMNMMYGFGEYGWGPGMMYGGTMGWFGGIGMILAWAFVIWLIVWAVREVRGGRGKGGSSAREILEERYARGEMTREEFLERKKDLS